MTQNCGKCDKVFVTKSALEEHMLSHDERQGSRKRGRPGSKIPCRDCDEVFYRRCDIRLHRRIVHKPKKNSCGVCGRTFSCEKRLKMHSQFHNNGGEYECFYCMKEFNKGWKLKIHLVNHSGRAPYICQYCKEDFLYPGKILEHLKREHGVMHSCKDCGVAFKNFDEQEDHLCKLYGCKDCCSYFITVEELASHAVHHSDGTLPVGIETTLPAFTPDSNHSVNEPLTVCHTDSEEMLPLCSQLSGSKSLRCSQLSESKSPRCSQLSEIKSPRLPSVTVNVTSCQQPVVNVSSHNNSSFEVNVSSNHPRVEVDVSCVQPSIDVLQTNESNASDLQGKDFNDSFYPTKFKIKTLNFGLSKWQFDIADKLTEQSQPNLSVVSEKDSDVSFTTKDTYANNFIDLTCSHNPLVKEITVCTLPTNIQCSGIESSNNFSFKVPITNWGPPKRSLSLVKNNLDNIERVKNNLDNMERFTKVNIGQSSSLRKNQDNIDRTKRANNLHEKEWKVIDDKNFIKEEQSSLESWLTGDSSPFMKHDFVFGLEGKESENIIDLTYNSSKSSFKKSGRDMTFEDLCQF